MSRAVKRRRLSAPEQEDSALKVSLLRRSDTFGAVAVRMTSGRARRALAGTVTGDDLQALGVPLRVLWPAQEAPVARAVMQLRSAQAASALRRPPGEPAHAARRCSRPRGCTGRNRRHHGW